MGKANRASEVRLDETLQTLTAQSERFAAQDVVVERLSQEIWQLKGEREALRSLAPAELSILAETLMEALQRVQRTHQQKLEQRMDEQLCIACLTERKNVVLQPCNHVTLCEGCFRKCSSVCPQCRCRVEDHLVIYM